MWLPPTAGNDSNGVSPWSSLGTCQMQTGNVPEATSDRVPKFHLPKFHRSVPKLQCPQVAVSPSCSVPKLQVAAPFGSGVLRDWQRRRHNRGPSAPRPADFRRYGDTPPLCSPLWGHTTYVPDNLDPIVQRVDTAGKPLAC